MSDVLFVTFPARYIHPSFAHRYLKANLDSYYSLKGQNVTSSILEFDSFVSPVEAVERILEINPQVVCFSTYIWNIDSVRKTADTLRRLSSELAIIAGGPEFDGLCDGEPLLDSCDFIVQGEGEQVIGPLCEYFLTGKTAGTGDVPAGATRKNAVDLGGNADVRRFLPEHVAVISGKLIQAVPPDVSKLTLPYSLYTDEDIANRVIYVETSRGCPLSCHYCSSSTLRGVRLFPLDTLFAEFDKLLERGVHHFKFVDRSFNSPPERACEILSWFLERKHREFYLHFEFLPVKLSDEMKDILRQFPEGTLHIEVGVQTFSEDISRQIGRAIRPEVVEETLRFLVHETSAIVHGDLIIGLPGDTPVSLAESFNRLWEIGVREIQLNLLKCLRGTPLSRYGEEFSMVFSSHPPYEVLSTSTMDFPTLRRLHEGSRVFNMLVGSENFPQVSEAILNHQDSEGKGTPFAQLMRFTEHILTQFHRSHHLSLKSLLEPVYAFLTLHMGLEPTSAGEMLALDYYDSGRRKRLPWLEERRKPVIK